MVYRFDQFEVDDQEFRLAEDGTPVPLEPKALRLLIYLIENRNRLVRKQELLDAVWPDAIVTENALTRAIGLLRKALNEDPRIPRHLETIPTAGYRFIANVTVADPVPAISSGATIESAPVGDGARRSSKWIPASVILLLVVASAGAFLYLGHRKPVLTEMDTVVLADFENSTGDPVFDGTLRQGMTVQLEQSPFLSLISDERIQKTLALMAQPAEAHLTPAIGREVCQRTGSSAVLDGSIAALGTQYVLGLRAVDCRTGDVIDVEQAQAARKEDVLNALSEIASRLRGRLGESLASVKQHDTPLAEATTPSLEALKAYSAAFKQATTVSSSSGIPLVKRAIEIDPQFAMAYAMLGRDYGDLGEAELSAESTRKAYELRNRSSDRERFFIDTSYEVTVTGDLEKARQICEEWAQTYPHDVSGDVNAHGFLSGMILGVLGRYEQALEEAKLSLAADPDAGFPYNNLALTDVALGHLEDAVSTLDRASQRKIDMPDFLVDRYQIAFLKGDQAEMVRIAALAMREPGDEDTVSDQQAFALAYSGRLQQARAMSQRAVEMAQQKGELERAAQLEAGSAVREGFFGNADAATRDAAAALKLSTGRDGQYGAAFALALAGDSSQAQTLVDDLERRFPDDTEVRFSYAPAVRGLLALHHGDPAKAIELLQVNVPYDLGTPTSSFYGFYGILYPVYVRGEAYLALHQGAQAAAEFQKILDHPGIVISDPVGALARLQIARAYAIEGNTAEANAAYQNFLVLWKDADSDIPILNEAKAEYAKLQ